jgi:DNA repair exonuclease SbcCD ATPase subunit
MTDFTDVRCGVCGIHFGVEADWEKTLRRTRGGFYCINGHPLSFTGKTPLETELDALKAEMKELRAKLQAAQAEVESQTKKVSELALELEIWKPHSIDDSSTPVERGKGTTAGLTI